MESVCTARYRGFESHSLRHECPFPGDSFTRDDKAMATSGNNVRLPEDLLAELEAQAHSRWHTVIVTYVLILYSAGMS